MMMRTQGSENGRRHRGFTLVEVILAIGIVALAGGLLLTSLAQSVKSEGKNRARDSAVRLEDVVRLQLADQGFEKLYTRLQDQAGPYYLYTYRADPVKLREDGTPVPAQVSDARLVPGFRPTEDPFLPQDRATVEGDVFRIRLIPFLHDPGEPYELPERDQYKAAALRLFVEVYQDFTPGENEQEWLAQRRVLSFPVSLSR